MGKREREKGGGEGREGEGRWGREREGEGRWGMERGRREVGKGERERGGGEGREREKGEEGREMIYYCPPLFVLLLHYLPNQMYLYRLLCVYF